MNVIALIAETIAPIMHDPSTADERRVKELITFTDPLAIATPPGETNRLFIVEQLSRRWGITREASRTRVWFEFDY